MSARGFLATLALVLAAAGCAPTPEVTSGPAAAIAVPGLPAMQRFPAAAPPPSQASNADLVRNFLDLSFALESGRTLERMTRFERPLTLRVTGTPPPSLRIDLARLLSRLRREAGIQIARTTAADAAITIEAIPRADIQTVLPEAACFVVPNVASFAEYRRAAGSPRTRWSTLGRRETVTLFVPSDVSPQETRDCLHEELAQALGPLNDLYRLPDSVFNDDNFHTVLTASDMLILRAYYDPALANGMDKATVAARLPAIFARLNPGGEARPARALAPTPPAWRDAIQTALGPGAGADARRRAANRAVQIAARAGWSDHRRGFAYFARGRLTLASNPAGARADFETAARYFGQSPDTAPHRAYAAAQRAAQALTQGDAATAARLTEPHLAPAARAENAALLSSLMLIRAEALAAMGERQEAERLRLDSLGWARYGFGPDWAVRAKIDEISALGAAAQLRRGGS